MSTTAKAMRHMAEIMGSKNPTGRNFTHYNNLVGEVNALVRGTEALTELFKSPNPYETKAANDHRVAQASAKLAKRADEAMAKMNEIAQRGFTDLSNRIDKLSGLKPGAYDQEIRSIFRSKSEGDKVRALNAALDAGDAELLSAILLAPTVVSGVSKEMSSHFRNAHEQRTAPAEFEERAQLSEGIQDTLAIIDTTRKAASEFLNPDSMRLAEEQAAKAAAAVAAFSEV